MDRKKKQTGKPADQLCTHVTQVLEAMGVRLKPQFVVDGINLTRDIHAENDDHILDNAWFLAAIATLQTRLVQTGVWTCHMCACA